MSNGTTQPATARAIDALAPALLVPMIEAAAAIVSLKDPFDRYRWVNQAFADLLGLETTAIIGSSDFDHWPDAAPALRGNDQRVLTRRRGAQFEEIVHLADGPRTLLAQKFPVLDAEGVPTAIASVATDITELTRATATLAARERVLSSVIGASPDVITILETDGTLRTTSIAFERVFGHPTRALVGRCLFDIVHPGDVTEVRAGFASLAEAGEQRSTLRFRIHRPGDEWVTIEAHAQLMVDEVGRDEGVVMVSRDVSDRIALEAELRTARDEAERASQAKSEFLSRVSHELRTPLNAMLGFAQLLELDGLEPPGAEYVDQILSAGDHLLQLINELLDLARVESPQLSLHPESVDAGALLADVVSLVGPLAARADVEVSGPPPPIPTVTAWADRQRVTQVMLNLLSNALKYNHPGGRVTVGIDRPPDDAGPIVRLWVHDTGPGLTEDQIGRLFVPFDRLGLDHSGIEGTGVGLSISRGLAERMGGRLGVRSSPGVGSTFWIDIPAERPAVVDHPETGADLDERVATVTEESAA